MMFSLSFAVFLFIIFGVNGQTDDIHIFRPNNLEKGYPFGKLRLSDEGKNEELIPLISPEKSEIHRDQPSGVQPLPSPCIGANSLTKLVYPRDKTKYIQCRDEFHYEIITCPNGGDYNDQTNSCDIAIYIIDICEQERPCLNGGQCISLSNSTFKCNCRPDWTGDRCDTPANSCVKKPCGPNADCRTLKTSDYEQDYVCVCHETRGYGLNCQEVVPNPCLTTAEQFFPFAFSQRAYIQCDGELIYFQPCGPLLFWHQEGKNCDRKRPAKADFPKLFTKLIFNNNDNQQEKNKEITIEETTTTTEQSELLNPLNQKGKEESEAVVAFVPARIANRQQLQANINNQQVLLGESEQKIQELPNQLLQPVESNQIRQDVISRTNPRLNQQTESTIRQPLTLQSGRSQSWPQSSQQQWKPMLTSALSLDTSTVQPQTIQQQPSVPQQKQVFNGQQWSNQIPVTQGQNNQQFVSQQQLWPGGSQTFPSQPQFQNPNQQPFIETGTSAQSVAHLQGLQNPSVQGQGQSWQNIPNTQFTGSQPPQSAGFNTQNTQHFATQQPSWQSGAQTVQNQPWLQNQNQQPFIETGASAQSVAHLQGLQNPNVQGQGQGQSWQNIPNSQFTGSQFPQSAGFNTQNPQFIGSQPAQSAGFNTQNTQHFAGQQPSWQSGAQTVQSQPWLQNQNQQPFIETGAPSQSVAHLQGLQNPNVQGQGQGQSWQNIPNSQFTGSQFPQSAGFNTQNIPNTQFTGSQFPQSAGFNTQNTQPFPAQPQPWKAGSQQKSSSTVPEVVSTDNKNLLNTGSQQKTKLALEQQTLQHQQPWQTKGNTQIYQSYVQPETSLIDIQLPLNNEVSFADQSVQNQPQFQNQNQQTFYETTTAIPSIVRPQAFQNPSTQVQEQSWQNKPTTQSIQDQSIKSHLVYAFQPKPWLDSSKQNQQPLNVNPSSEIQNTQIGLNQQQNNVLNQNSYEQNQPWSQTGSMTGNSFETTTIANKGLSMQGTLQGWKPSRPVEQDNNQIITTDQRKALDSIPTSVSGTWKSRS